MKSFRMLFTDHFPAWAHEPEAMVRLDQLPDDGVWQAHEGGQIGSRPAGPASAPASSSIRLFPPSASPGA